MGNEGIPDASKVTNNKPLLDIIRLILICILSTTISIALNNIGVGKENVLMVFLMGVLVITAVTKGYIYGAIASILSVMLFNYFFTEPFYSFIMNEAKDYMLILFFLIASLISSSMTSKFQQQAIIAKRNERTARLLYEITKGFLHVTGIDNIVKKGINYITDYTGYQCRVKLDCFENVFCSPNVSNEIYEEQEIYKIPIKGLAKQMGTLEIINEKLPIPSENNMLIKAIVYQMAMILDREFMYNEREKIKVDMESEHLKSTLLRSISHDLRTPLTGIIGATELILDSLDKLDTQSLKKLVTDIKEESSWLYNSVQNILDMTMISDDRMALKKDYEAVDDLINQTLTLLPQLTSSGRLKVSIPDDIVLIHVDGRLIVHVLVNLLDNAYKHSGEDSKIELKAYFENDCVVFEIIDNGSGISPELSDTLFEGFVTLNNDIADGRRGVGLGLAICKAIVNAHNGSITATNQSTGGAVFKIVLPVEEM